MPERLQTETIRAALRSKARRRMPLVPPYERPTSRAQCAEFARPCPYVGCRYNLSLDVTFAGSIRFRMGTDWSELRSMHSNCALDLAAQKSHTLGELAAIFGCTKERIRQEEAVAIQKLRDLDIPVPEHQGVMPHLEYTVEPEMNDMQAAGLPEEDPWIRDLWRQAMTDEKP